MKVKAIVYTSNTGYTAEYAKLLGEKTGLPVFSLKECTLEKESEIIYLGWLRAGSIVDYKKASKLYDIKILVGSCLGTTGSMDSSVRKSHKLPDDMPVFTLWGGFDINKLHGIYKLMMKIVGKAIKNKILENPTQTEEDRKIIDMLDNGGSAVDEKYLVPILMLLK